MVQLVIPAKENILRVEGKMPATRSCAMLVAVTFTLSIYKCHFHKVLLGRASSMDNPFG
jgi:hypothetical protein